MDLRHRPRVDRGARGDREAAAGGGADPLGPGPRARSWSGCGSGGRRRARPSSSSSSGWGARSTTTTSGSRWTTGYARAVLTMFVAPVRQGLHLPRQPAVNWCPTCASTISDLEVRYEHAADTLFEVRYPIKGADEFLTVATVRPETILADTAVAVHPDDERYRHLVGHTAIVPLVDREVPIIADEYVKTDFGTGALKITPGHDPNDFEIGRRHGLEELIGDRLRRPHDRAGRRVRRAAGRGGARSGCVDALVVQQLLAGEQHYEHEVGHCDRTGDRIEPLISLQWFMRDGRAGARRPTRRCAPGGCASTQDAGEHLLRLDGQPPPVVRVAPALVGPPDPGLVLPGRPPDGGADEPTACATAGRPSWSATPTCWTRGSRRRCGRSPPSAGRSDDPADRSTRERALDRPATSSTCGWPGC